MFGSRFALRVNVFICAVCLFGEVKAWPQAPLSLCSGGTTHTSTDVSSEVAVSVVGGVNTSRWDIRRSVKYQKTTDGLQSSGFS